MGTRADSDAVDLEVRLLLEAIHARYGYDLRGYAGASMRRRVLAALARYGLAHIGELQHRVLTEPAFFAELLEELLVRVTHMFRDPSFYLAFRATAVPLLRTYPRLNLWHAGCASGEEVYSVAILLSEVGLYDRCQIYATDLSARALEHAKKGLYPIRALASLDDSYRRAGGAGDPAAYYTAAYDHIAVRESLRRNILFFQHDLVGDHVFAEVQVIFCRNVLIYFGGELRERAMSKLARSLSPGGLLCLGSSERLAGPSRALFSDFVAEERIYRQDLSS